MNRILTGALALVMLGTTSANAENIKHDETGKQFRKEFKTGTNEKRSSDDSFFYVSFEKNGELNSAVYLKENGELVGTAALKDAGETPSSVKKLLQNKFTGYRITGKVIEIAYADYDAYVVSVENSSELLTIRVEGKSASVTKRMKKM